MNASHLCEDGTAGDGLVGWNSDTAIALHHVCHFVQFLLVDMCACVEMILQNGLNRGQRRIAGTLAESVDGCVKAACTAQYGSEDIRYGQVVVVVGVEVKMNVGIALHHASHVADEVQRIEYAEGVG